MTTDEDSEKCSKKHSKENKKQDTFDITTAKFFYTETNGTNIFCDL